MADYSLRDLWWLQPKGPDNPLPALQLGAQIVQNKARLDLQERDLANDIARTSLMREEMLAKQKIQTQLVAANAAIASKMSNVTDFNDDEQWADLMATFADNPIGVGGKAYLGAMHLRESARTAKRLEEEARSRIDERNRRADMAGNIGWVYPEDGSPPYLVDAKGGTKFAPFHAGIEAGFAPQKTTIGGIDLIQTSPLRWQVVNKPMPSGRMTDLEKADLSDIRKQRQLLVDALPSEVPKLGMFGGNKDAVSKYSKETNAIAALTAREEALRKTVEGRSSKTAPPEEAAPPSGLPTINSKEEYDKLEPGKRYIAPDGSTRTKG